MTFGFKASTKAPSNSADRKMPFTVIFRSAFIEASSEFADSRRYSMIHPHTMQKFARPGDTQCCPIATKGASMETRNMSRSAEIRARLGHPVIDSDGHVVEFQPAFLDHLRDVAGAAMIRRFDESRRDIQLWYDSSAEERKVKRLSRPGWWSSPTRNTLDRATSTLPQLLNERLEEFGIDFTVLYPTAGLRYAHYADEELRRATCRAQNSYQSTIFREFSRRIAPVALIPMHTPQEAIEELEYSVRQLGMKAVMMASFVLRPRADGQGHWYDNFCLDSLHDYDPVWAKCIELGSIPTFHSSTQGFGTRNSTSNYMFNHIGHFAASGEAVCKAAFMGGVTRRFPKLRMAFLEGGVGWACTLYSDLIARWKKRNRNSIENYNPSNLDQSLYWDLFDRYGGKMVEGKLADAAGKRLAMNIGFAGIGPSEEDPATLDDFSQCGLERPEDIRDQFVRSFYFGCEADDPINAWAFDSKKNPYGARLKAIFSSDIGHWDVPDMREVVEEAYELVEDGLISESDFSDFVFRTPYEMWTSMNPDFFKGTSIEGHAPEPRN